MTTHDEIVPSKLFANITTDGMHEGERYNIVVYNGLDSLCRWCNMHLDFAGCPWGRRRFDNLTDNMGFLSTIIILRSNMSAKKVKTGKSPDYYSIQWLPATGNE